MRARRAVAVAAVAALSLTALVAVAGRRDDARAATPEIVRIAGADRYETAALVSQAAYPTAPVDVAFVATGTNFPDALGAGPAAAKFRAPVLLTEPENLPPATVSELQRLQPATIVAVGGEAAISAAVFTQLQSLARVQAIRRTGDNRIQTAANVSAGTFLPGVPVAYVANRNRFPDALAGGPAAGAGGGPVLLVTPDEIPNATGRELSRVRPTAIVVLGAGGVIGSGVEQQLRAYAPNVGRSSGVDRYGTAVAVSRNAFSPGVPLVLLATGENFPDALAGGAWGGVAPGPLLLVQRDCVPPEVRAEIDRLAPARVVVLGGPTAVAPAVESLFVCGTTPPTTSTTPTTTTTTTSSVTPTATGA